MSRITLLLLALLALVAASLFSGDAQSGEAVMWLRAWRACGAICVGAALAVAGVIAQAVFHNPLASPDVIGVTAGASLGGQAALVLGLTAAPDLLVPLGCLAGAWAALAVLAAVARRRADPVAVLLAGVMVGTLAVSLGGLMTAMALESWQLGRALVAFTLGGLDAIGPRQLALAGPGVLVGLAATSTLATELDLLRAGDEEATALGLDVDRTRQIAILWAGALSGCAVALAGGVAFVGLVVPHLARAFVGARHATLLPAAAVGGALFVLAADVTARVVPTTGDLPLGVITGLVGAPFLLRLLLRGGQ